MRNTQSGYTVIFSILVMTLVLASVVSGVSLQSFYLQDISSYTKYKLIGKTLAEACIRHVQTNMATSEYSVQPQTVFLVMTIPCVVEPVIFNAAINEWIIQVSIVYMNTVTKLRAKYGSDFIIFYWQEF